MNRNFKFKSIIAIMAAVILVAVGLVGCGSSSIEYDDARVDKLSKEDAITEMEALLKRVDVSTVQNPTLDIYSDEISEADALSDIDVYDIMVQGHGDIDIEIAAATELSSTAPDDWLNVVAEKFNKEKNTVNGKTVSVSVRKIASGEVLTYMVADAYRPDAYIPSNDAWGKMMEASGIDVEMVTDRILGNTAGILLSKEANEKIVEKYGEVTIANVVEANLNGDIVFAYTNPYTSSTGLNILTAILKAFDSNNPLSKTASDKLLEYQKQAPPVAYTTGVLRTKAAKGIINAMVMEEQAYINTQSLSDYIYIPAGIRHDHPVYTFDYVSSDKKEAIQMFVDYCMKDENQKLGTDKGFNRHEEYVGQDSGLDGAGYLEAQSLWKQNKNGGNPTVAVFVADTSGSMSGTPLASLKESLIAGSNFIGSDNYVGLVSYADDVTIHLNVGKFDFTQRAYFSGEVKNLSASGGTATYDAVMVAAQMLQDAAKEIPDAKLMLFVLTDGDTNAGLKLNRITPVIAGLEIPVYTIAYNYSNTGELETLSGINEAATIKADSDNIANELRNLFNVEG